MRNPARPVAFVGLALALLAGPPGVGPPTARGAGPSVAITVPSPGVTLVAGPLFRLGWSESAPARAPIVARTVIQYSGAVTENRTCPRAIYALDWIDAGTVPPMRYPLSGLRDGICHYWTVTVRDLNGLVTRARSGYVIGAPAPDPRVAFSFPMRGAPTNVPPRGATVTWSELSSDGVASRSVVQLVTGQAADGGCDAAGWTVDRILGATGPSLSVEDLAAGSCYRYAVTLRDLEGRTAQARSGPLLVSATPPTCAYADVASAPFGDEDWATVPLDATYRLPSDYVPPDLVRTRGIADLTGTFRVRRVAYDDLAALADAARAADVPIDLTSAFRSYAEQQAVHDFYVDLAGPAKGILLAARPGHSEHQLGTAIDVKALGGRSPQSFADWTSTRTGAWLRDNAWRYGWVMAYPKKGSPARSCYAYEPWHYRYVGRDVAEAVHASGRSLREYLWREGLLPSG
jgi:D-alanyl-D-alanine carboxypeptidase